MPQAHGFPLDLPAFNSRASVEAWQRRMTELLDFTVDHGVVTTDATQTVLGSVVLEDGRAYLIESWVLASEPTPNGEQILVKSQLMVFRGGFHLDNAGVAQVAGAGVSKIYSGVNRGYSAEHWSGSMDVTTNTVRQLVTGATGEIVIWKGRFKIFTAQL